MQATSKRQVWSWALYDWANSAYVTVVMVVFFPIFFREYWANGLPSEQITLQLGIANSVSSLLIVAIAPFLGAMADRAGLKKQLLILFASIGILSALSLPFVAQGNWHIAVAVFIVGTIGFMGGNVFYDSLLVDVAEEKDFNRVSAFGFALGYFGGGSVFALCVVMTMNPEWFGMDSVQQAVKASFAVTAIWWAVFTIPLWLWVEEAEQKKSDETLLQLAKSGFLEVKNTFLHIREQRIVWVFLLAYWLYIDGVDTIVRMAVDYGKALGFDNENMITALLITQFVAFPAALFFGWLGHRIGAKRGILIGLAGYVLITIGGAFMSSVNHFYALSVSIGLIQGGVQALSRSMYASIIPQERAAEFFGFYNMLGKFAAVLGPLMVGWVGVLTGSPRMGLLAILVLFVSGAVLLWKVPEHGPRRNE